MYLRLPNETYIKGTEGYIREHKVNNGTQGYTMVLNGILGYILAKMVLEGT